MERQFRSWKGFTLIELTVVVTVISILAAIAIPNFIKFIAKSKQSEAKSMLPLIASYEFDYKLRHGKFIECPMNPSEGNERWDLKVAGWKELGFEPKGLRYYSYEVVLKEDKFTVRAVGDIDDDETVDVWELYSEDMTVKNVSNDVDT